MKCESRNIRYVDVCWCAADATTLQNEGGNILHAAWGSRVGTSCHVARDDLDSWPWFSKNSKSVANRVSDLATVRIDIVVVLRSGASMAHSTVILHKGSTVPSEEEWALPSTTLKLSQQQLEEVCAAAKSAPFVAPDSIRSAVQRALREQLACDISRLHCCLKLFAHVEYGTASFGSTHTFVVIVEDLGLSVEEILSIPHNVQFHPGDVSCHSVADAPSQPQWGVCCVPLETVASSTLLHCRDEGSIAHFEAGLVFRLLRERLLHFFLNNFASVMREECILHEEVERQWLEIEKLKRQNPRNSEISEFLTEQEAALCQNSQELIISYAKQAFFRSKSGDGERSRALRAVEECKGVGRFCDSKPTGADLISLLLLLPVTLVQAEKMVAHYDSLCASHCPSNELLDEESDEEFVI